MKKIFAVFLIALSLSTLLSACGDDYDAQDLEDAKQRYFSGEYTKEDEIMVEGFLNWKADQDKYID